MARRYSAPTADCLALPGLDPNLVPADVGMEVSIPERSRQDGASLERALRERGGQLVNEEVIWTTKQGQAVHLLISYVQVAYKGGLVGGKRVAWLYDITSLRQAEEARRRSEPRLAEAIESISEGFVFYDADELDPALMSAAERAEAASVLRE